MLFIQDVGNCFKIQCGHYTISLTKQSSWYNVLIDNETNSLPWEEARHITGVVFKILNPNKEWGRDSEWAISDYTELSEILVALKSINNTLNDHYKGEPWTISQLRQ
jgi:hypothetical protein